ncbi:MAG: alpha/beta hydrolase [Gallionella sp.]|nr:alpha/beta hydrolase [Gallionella sp.]
MYPGYTRIKLALLGAVLLSGVSACAAVDPRGKTQQITALAEKHGFGVIKIRQDVFRLAVFSRDSGAASDTMDVYIEGDGAAWITPYRPPDDPTPPSPMSLALASVDPAHKVVYLGRPCQYLDEESLRNCKVAYWTERRFSPEVVLAYEDALTQLKSVLGVRRMRLIGYSGGGVIAALLAARRSDVESLITVAAPLAVSTWIVWHGATPLTGSLDPSESGGRLPQGLHFAGGQDKIVPVSVVEEFVRRKGGRMQIRSDFDHDCCWVRDWAVSLAGISALKGENEH